MLFGHNDCIRKLSSTQLNSLVAHFRQLIEPFTLLKHLVVFEIHSFYDINLLLGKIDSGLINMTIKFDELITYTQQYAM